MSMSHRPSDETLAAFAAGRLDEGLALVVAAHVEINPQSRRDLAEIDALSGAFLDTIDPEPMDVDARSLSIALPQRSAEPPQRPAAPPDAAGLAVLAPYTL